MSIRPAARALALLLGFAIPIRAEVTVLEADDHHVIFEIVPPAARVEPVVTTEREYVRLEIPGFGLTEEEGRPEIPVRSVRVALPPGTTPRLTVVSEQWSEVRPGAVRPVPARIGVREAFGPNRVEEREPREGVAYRSSPVFPEEAFSLGGAATMRHLRTVPVVVHGARADVFRRGHRLLERAVLEVRFEAARGRDADRTARPAPSDPRWKRTYARSVVNADAATTWGRAGLGDATAVGDTPFGGGDQWKIVVLETGLAEVSFATLAALGFPAGVPVDHVSLYQRGFDLDRVDDPATPAPDLFTMTPVPADVADANGNSEFDAGDAVRFYGRSFRDQWMTSGWEHEDRFSQENAVWIRIDPAGGARFPIVREAGSLSGAAGDSLASTPQEYFREWDRKFYRRPPDFGPGRSGFESEFFFWNDSRDPTGGANGWKAKAPGNGPELFETIDLVPGSAGTVTVRVVGGGRPVDSNYTNRFEVNVNSQDPPLGERTFTNSLLYVQQNVPADSVLTTFPVPGGVLVDGTNEFQFTGWTYQGFGTNTIFYSTRFFFDWYRIEYARRLVARNDLLELRTSNGTAGNQIVRVEGFGGSDLALYDVSDPVSPARVGIDPAQIVDAGGLFDLRFDHDNGPAEGAYVAVRESAVPAVPDSQVVLVPAGNALAGGVGAQYVVVAHEDFVAGAQELADYRSSKYSTHVVPVGGIWDVFGNGHRSPRAIKNFTAYAFHRWTTPIEHLCLVGDGSEDTRGVTNNSEPDFIPSHGVWASYEGAHDASDQYYCEVTRGSPADADGFDDLADFHVGRLAVSDSDELQWNLDRIRRYETTGQRELWRRSVMFHADDAISGSLGGGLGTPYGFRSVETLFESNSDAYAESLRVNHSDQIVPQKVYQSSWTSPCPDSCYTNPAAECEDGLGIDCGYWYDCRDDPVWQNVYTCVKGLTSVAVLAALRDRIARGVLVWNYQGHANRYFMSHEETFRDDNIGSPRHDVDTLENEGRPFVFLGWACHLGEYDTAEEGDTRVQDCMVEKMMNVRQPGMTVPGGAVAAFASSGFEFLTPNITFNRIFVNEMFPPDYAGDPPSTLGEALTLSRLVFQTAYPVPGNTRQAAQRFLLFGDPALEPDLGESPLHVTANGDEVTDGHVLPLRSDDEPVEIVARTAPGSGAIAFRILDSRRGEIPVEEYAVTGADPLELSYQAPPRTGSRELTIVAVDGRGRSTSFTLGLRADLELQGLAVYPNPFSDVTHLYHDVVGAESMTLRIFTLNGRKIREITEPIATSPGRLEWDGRDAQGNPVANGTYLVQVVARGSSGSIEEMKRVVRMR